MERKSFCVLLARTAEIPQLCSQQTRWPNLKPNPMNDRPQAVTEREDAILKQMGLTRELAEFDYNQEGKLVKLDLITKNPRHNQSFLFQTVRGIDQTDALDKMLDYVKEHKNITYVYTIQWTARDDEHSHISYFRGTNMYDVLDKFYYGRDMNQITIFSIVLNPEA